MDQENKNCCALFNSRINNAKLKGFSISFESNLCHLIFRSINEKDENLFLETFREKLLGSKLPNMALSGKMVIKFCPFCGEKIKEEPNLSNLSLQQ